MEICRDDLLQALKALKDLAKGKLHPILKNVKLEACQETLVVSATDLAVFAELYVPIITEGEAVWSCLVPHKTLTALLRTIKAKLVSLDLHAAGLCISAGDGAFVLPSTEIEEFPEFPASPDMEDTRDNLPAEIIEEFKRAKFVISDDASRAQLCGVYWEKDKIIATDGKRLVETQAERVPALVGYSIPKAVIDPLQYLTQCAPDFSFGHKESLAEFATGHGVVRTRLIEGAPPDYQSCLPKTYDYYVTVPRADLARAIKRLQAADPQDCLTVLVGEDVRLQIGGNSSALVSAKILENHSTSGPVTQTFKAAFILDGLKVLGKKDSVTLALSSTGPAVMAFRNWRYHFMPVAGART